MMEQDTCEFSRGIEVSPIYLRTSIARVEDIRLERRVTRSQGVKVRWIFRVLIAGMDAWWFSAPALLA